MAAASGVVADHSKADGFTRNLGLPGTDTGPPSVERCYCAFFAAASQIQTN
jgi:hypothetical protein